MNTLDELLRQEMPLGVEPIPLPLNSHFELTLEALYRVADKLHGTVSDLELRLASVENISNERYRAIQVYRERDREILLKGGTKGPGMTNFFGQRARSFFKSAEYFEWSAEEKEDNLAALLSDMWTMALAEKEG